MFKGGRCLCIDRGAKVVKMAAIKEVSVIYPSNGCDKVEVMYVMEMTMVWVLLFCGCFSTKV